MLQELKTTRVWKPLEVDCERVWRQSMKIIRSWRSTGSEGCKLELVKSCYSEDIPLGVKTWRFLRDSTILQVPKSAKKFPHQSSLWIS